MDSAQERDSAQETGSVHRHKAGLTKIAVCNNNHNPMSHRLMLFLMILTVATDMTIPMSNHIQWRSNKSHSCRDLAKEMESIWPALDRK